MDTSTNEYVSTLEIPEGISVTLEGRTILVQGKLGTVKKDFTKLPAFLTIEKNTIKIQPYGTRRKDFAISKAYSAAFNECSEPSTATIIFENFECDTAVVD